VVQAEKSKGVELGDLLVGLRDHARFLNATLALLASQPLSRNV